MSVTPECPNHHKGDGDYQTDFDYSKYENIMNPRDPGDPDVPEDHYDYESQVCQVEPVNMCTEEANACDQ